MKAVESPRQVDQEGAAYILLQEKQQREWEDACRMCGACCGVLDGDPCEYLREAETGKYFCSIYKNRFGEHRTQSGKAVKCVPIREILHKSWPGGTRCAYKKERSKTKSFLYGIS